jgi:hypothetical protein
MRVMAWAIRIMFWVLVIRLLGIRVANAVALVFDWPFAMRRLRKSGGEDAVQLARFLRTAVVWSILMLGSGLLLIASILTLIHDA